MILIDAVYINSGGGKSLLQELLLMLRGKAEVALLRDTRMVDLDTCGLRIFDLPHNERARTQFYEKYANQIRRIFCFGNVPPPRRLPVHTIVYFHNILLCQPDSSLSWWNALRCRIKMAYIRFRRHNADCFLVQSDTVANALRMHIGSNLNILVAPFYASAFSTGHSNEPNRWCRYAYVSNAYVHKNHHRLLEAWRRLAAEGIRPELHLTIYGNSLSEFESLLAMASQNGAQIINHGFTDPSLIYAKCGYQIYPSLSESFGLGLVEAAEAGCAVIASERPYVRSVIHPHDTFNPMSVDEIVESVRRTYGRPSVPSLVITPNRLDNIVNWIATGEPLS